MAEPRVVAAREWTVKAGERARLTPEGPTAAVVEARRPLPLRVRACEGKGPLARLHPGTAVVLGSETYEVLRLDEEDGRLLYRLAPWSRDLVIRDRVVYGARLVEAAAAERRQLVGQRVAAPVRPLLEMAAALLPAPERKALVDRLLLDPLRGTLLVGLLQVVGCGLLWPVGFVAMFRGHLDSVQGQIGRENRDATVRDLRISEAYAVTAPMAYLVTPTSIVLLYGFWTGVARLVHARTSGMALADPLLSLLLGGARLARSRSRRRRRLGALGPERPDRVTEDGDGLLVFSAREKPEWTNATVQVGERFLRVSSVADRPDGAWTAICYRLAPLPPGSVYRNLVHYTPPSATTAVPGPRHPEEPRPAGATKGPPPLAAPAPLAVPEPAAPGPGHPEEPRPAGATKGPPGTPGTAARSRWRVDEGEEARVTPQEGGDAVIESLGSLPFRTRSQALGVHHRPEFPGTCVVLGGEHYEVVSERARETGFVYVLERWQRGLVRRDLVEYGPRLVRAAQREREEAAGREARARYASLSMFLLGLLPEERQVRACERHGVAADNATIAGAGLELVIALGLLALLPHVGRLLLAFPIALLVVAPAVLRVIGSLAWGDVAGSPLVALLLGVRAALPGRLDTTLVPLTREAFWARLALPDRQEPLETHDLLVKGLLPHLSWAGSPLSRAGGTRATIEVDDEYWQVTPRPALLEQGRLSYAYELRTPPGRNDRTDLPRPAWPDPRTYQWEVLGDVARQWDGVFAGFAWLPTLLPRDVQERAYRGRGGVAAGRRWTLATIAVTFVLAAWFASGAGAFNSATALLLFADAVQRSWRAASGGCAPSVFGLAIAPLLRAERLSYHAHRDAERETLLALGVERRD